jgi:hypothetical protein
MRINKLQFIAKTNMTAPFGSSLFLKYSKNTAVSENTTVYKTLRCLALTDIEVSKTTVSPKLLFF